MDNTDTDFDTWFDTVQTHVLDQTGVQFNDRDSVKGDYDEGLDAFDVIDEIVSEYS